MNIWQRIFVSGLVGFVVVFGVRNADAAERVIQLFDGRSLDGWTTASGDPVTRGWTVEDGMLVRHARGGAIYTAEEYGDFDLRFEWKIAPGGNSGVKYRVAFYNKGIYGNPGWLGCEYQLYDDVGRRANPITSTGSIYAIYAPNEKKQLHPVGEFNHSRIVARGSHIEHWLNDEKIVDADTESADWKSRISRSKFGVVDGFFQNARGRIQLQDHGSQVWFRKIELRLAEEQ